MEIEQYHRQERMIGSAGNVIAKPSNSYGELEQLGNTLTKVGFAIAEQEQQAQYNNQMQNASLAVDKAYEEERNSLSPDDTENWKPRLEKLHESLGPKLEKILTNGKARNDFSPILERKIFNQTKELNDYKTAINARNYQRDYYRNYDESQDITAQQPTPGGYDQHALDHLEITYGLQLKKDAKLTDEIIDITDENIDKYFETKEGYESPIFESIEQRKSEAKRWTRGTKEKYNLVQKKKIREVLLNQALALDDGEQIIDNANAIAEDNYGFEGDLFEPDEIDRLKETYQATRNSAEKRAQEEFDLRSKQIEQELWNLQKENKLTVKELNDPEVMAHLSVPEQRTFWNALNNTKTYTDEEKATAHTEGIETMVAFRSGQMKKEDAKKIIDKLRSSGAVDAKDGQSWTEELLGFKKSPDATSGNNTAMDLGIKSITQILGMETKIIETGVDPDDPKKAITGNEITNAIAKRNSKRNQQIIDLEAWVKAEPRTPTEINEHVESVLAPAKKKIIEEQSTRSIGKWLNKFLLPPEMLFSPKSGDVAKTKNDAKERALLLFKEVIENPKNGEIMGRNSKDEKWQKVI